MTQGKQVCGVALVAVALAAGAGSVLAQERDKNWSVTVGVKAWYNQWDTSIPAGTLDANSYYGISNISRPQRWAFIPNLAVRYKDYFVSGGYFTKTSYSFPEVFFSGTRVSLRADRTEADLNLGYFVVPQFALAVGYKKVKQDYDISFPDSSAATITSTTKYNGLTVGMIASGPIGGGFSLYANASSGRTHAKYSDGGSSHGWYGSSELGLAHPIAKGAVLSLGAKYQVLNTGGVGRDVTTGLILGANYTF